jgi:hypothetical protein
LFKQESRELLICSLKDLRKPASHVITPEFSAWPHRPYQSTKHALSAALSSLDPDVQAFFRKLCFLVSHCEPAGHSLSLSRRFT